MQITILTHIRISERARVWIVHMARTNGDYLVRISAFKTQLVQIRSKALILMHQRKTLSPTGQINLYQLVTKKLDEIIQQDSNQGCLAAWLHFIRLKSVNPALLCKKQRKAYSFLAVSSLSNSPTKRFEIFSI